VKVLRFPLGLQPSKLFCLASPRITMSPWSLVYPMAGLVMVFRTSLTYLSPLSFFCGVVYQASVSAFYTFPILPGSRCPSTLQFQLAPLYLARPTKKALFFLVDPATRLFSRKTPSPESSLLACTASKQTGPSMKNTYYTGTPFLSPPGF